MIERNTLKNKLLNLDLGDLEESRGPKMKESEIFELSGRGESEYEENRPCLLYTSPSPRD